MPMAQLVHSSKNKNTNIILCDLYQNACKFPLIAALLLSVLLIRISNRHFCVSNITWLCLILLLAYLNVYYCILMLTHLLVYNCTCCFFSTWLGDKLYFTLYLYMCNDNEIESNLNQRILYLKSSFLSVYLISSFIPLSSPFVWC